MWVLFGLGIGAVLIGGIVVWRRWQRWRPTPPTSEDARAAEFRVSTYRDTGGI